MNDVEGVKGKLMRKAPEPGKSANVKIGRGQSEYSKLTLVSLHLLIIKLKIIK